MKRLLSPFLCIVLAGCLRNLFHETAPVQEDPSIVFPSFFAQAPVTLGTLDVPYELDGVTLRALSIAANDFFPQEDNPTRCEDRQESHVYRVIRQGDVFFVRIDQSPAHCGQTHGALDAGAKYAIHRNGRILRRVFDGMEPYVSPADASTPVPGEPGVSPSFDPQHPRALPFLPSSTQDGGTAPGPDGGTRPPP
jgi:hypothetical protein